MLVVKGNHFTWRDKVCINKNMKMTGSLMNCTSWFNEQASGCHGNREGGCYCRPIGWHCEVHALGVGNTLGVERLVKDKPKAILGIGYVGSNGRTEAAGQCILRVIERATARNTAVG